MATNNSINNSVVGGNFSMSAGNITFAGDSNSAGTVGIIKWGSDRVITCFSTSDGNYFFGGNAGNLSYTAGSAQFNIGIGSNSMAAFTTSPVNCSFGVNSLNALTSGTGRNCGFGGSTLASLTTGQYNVGIGNGGGSGYTGSEAHNICINANGTASESNVLNIGAGTGTGTQQLNKAVICGITGKTSASGVAVLVNSSNVLGTTTSSIKFKTNVQDMGDSSSGLYQLRPVTFNFKWDPVHVSQSDTAITQYGLIAEEVDKIVPDLTHYNDKGEIESVRYLNLIPMLLNELQKLEKRFNAMSKRVAKMEKDKQLFSFSDLQRALMSYSFNVDLLDDALKNEFYEVVKRRCLESFSEMKLEWDDKLKNNGIKSIPEDPEEYALLVFAQSNYRDKKTRDAWDSWINLQQTRDNELKNT